MSNIIGYNSSTYLRSNPFAYQHRNGAYYYSKEIVNNIIPRVRTERPWVTINDRISCFDHAIVFIHNNLHPENYGWLEKFDDLVLVCSQRETQVKMSHLGRAIYLPLSIDVKEVEQYKREKVYDTAFVGRKSKIHLGEVPEGTIALSGMPRELLLAKMAMFKNVYAVGRCALEAKVLGCNILPYDRRFPDTSIWQVLDNADAALILQRKLDEIDKN